MWHKCERCEGLAPADKTTTVLGFYDAEWCLDCRRNFSVDVATHPLVVKLTTHMAQIDMYQRMSVADGVDRTDQVMSEVAAQRAMWPQLMALIQAWVARQPLD